MDLRTFPLVVLCATMAVWPFASGAQGLSNCAPMALPVERLTPPPSPYADFCAREPEACALEGDAVLAWSVPLHEQLSAINSAVNSEIRFTPDIGNSGREESWDFPVSGFGDCEDYALEKRQRLIAEGVPSAALTCAVVIHESRYFLHTVLLAETSAGTLVLDDRSDEVMCWTEVPYVFRLRERPDGMWTRFAVP
jgi:predicted transglutaminase-like cysteine proteinase